MARFFGNVGFGIPVENDGIWTDDIVERPYYGDFQRMSKRSAEREYVNDDLVLVNTVSIIADAFAEEHFFAIRYVCWMGARWRVQSVEVVRPRINMTLGEVWNGAIPRDDS